MAKADLRIGVVGVGSIGPSHIFSIGKASGCRLTAVCDVNEKAARSAGETHHVPWYSSADTMLSSGSVDAITVSTPSGFHLDVALSALNRDIHVLVEKPIEITTERIDRIISAEKRSKAIVACVYQSRFRPVVSEMKRQIDAGLLGRMFSGSAYIKRYRTQQYYDSGGWRGTWKVDGGGCLMNQGIHLIDLYLWIMGLPEYVIGYTDSRGRDVEVETVAHAIAGFQGGATGVVEATTLAYPEFEPYIELCGERGTAVFSSTRLISMNLLQPTPAEQAVQEQLSEITARIQATQAARKKAAAGTAVPNVDMGHTPVIQDFVDSVVQGRQPAVPSEEGRRAVEFITAIYASSRNRNSRIDFS